MNGDGQFVDITDKSRYTRIELNNAQKMTLNFV